MVTYQINCSFGEIVDKLSILHIKLGKATNDIQYDNILNEYNSIKMYKKDNDEIFNQLYDTLYDINNTLWELEDTIRFKTHNKLFDESFIDCAIQIHKMNDLRYSIKNNINNKYNSTIKEEKIYKQL
tara:strand:- start:1581 stop:1961 length:381 start_codon:yes stop_codon:yes gene_type:complete